MARPIFLATVGFILKSPNQEPYQIHCVDSHIKYQSWSISGVGCFVFGITGLCIWEELQRGVPNPQSRPTPVLPSLPHTKPSIMKALHFFKWHQTATTSLMEAKGYSFKENGRDPIQKKQLPCSHSVYRESQKTRSVF